MAVHRKRPPPRNLLSGTRLRRSMTIVAALLVLAGTAPIAARAQEGGGLSAGASAFASGKYDAAVRQLTSAINSEGLSPESTAKALYYRGLAY